MNSLLSSVRALLHDRLPRRHRLRPRLEILEDRLAPAVLTSLFNTGVDDLGNALADGAADPHYSITAAPSPVTPGAASVVLQNGFPFDGHWLPDGGLSKWIAPHANENDFSGGVSESPGNYVYETTFDLTGFDPFTASISGQYNADNTLVQVLLNGVDAGVPAGTSTDYFGFHSFSISAGFQEGVNTLEFVVHNLPQVDHPNNLHNPSGLRVEMTGTAASKITATLTADNHYGLYFGSEGGGSLTLVGRNEDGATGSPGTANWSLPETWTFTPGDGDYIYVVAWDGLNEFGIENGGPQSWIGQFQFADGSRLSSNATDWEFVVASGPNPSNEDGELPQLSELMTAIAGASWTAPQVFAPNGTAPWGTIPGIAPDAQFIWSDAFDANAQSDDHYVIFRTLSNAPPLAADDIAFTNENASATIPVADLLANDSDLDGDTISVVSVTATSDHGGAVLLDDNGTPGDASDDSVTYTPAPNFFGVDSFQYTIQDSLGLTDTATVFVSVNSISGVTATLTADNHYGLYYGNVNGSSLTPVGRNENSFAGNPGDYNWSLPETFNFNVGASDYIYVLVWDDGGPQMWAGQFELPTGETLVSNLSQWQYTIANGPKPAEDGPLPPLQDVASTIAGAVWLAPGASAPNGTSPWGGIPGLQSNVQFLWHDTLGENSTSNDHYVIFRTAAPVLVVNGSPVANSDIVSTTEGVPVDIDVLANDTDPDSDALQILGVSQPTHGFVVQATNGTLTYAPQNGFFGTDSFGYTVSDGKGGTATGVVTVTVGQQTVDLDGKDATLDADWLSEQDEDAPGMLVATASSPYEAELLARQTGITGAIRRITWDSTYLDITGAPLTSPGLIELDETDGNVELTVTASQSLPLGGLLVAMEVMLGNQFLGQDAVKAKDLKVNIDITGPDGKPLDAKVKEQLGGVRIHVNDNFDLETPGQVGNKQGFISDNLKDPRDNKFHLKADDPDVIKGAITIGPAGQQGFLTWSFSDRVQVWWKPDGAADFEQVSPQLQNLYMATGKPIEIRVSGITPGTGTVEASFSITNAAMQIVTEKGTFNYVVYTGLNLAGDDAPKTSYQDQLANATGYGLVRNSGGDVWRTATLKDADLTDYQKAAGDVFRNILVNDDYRKYKVNNSTVSVRVDLIPQPFDLFFSSQVDHSDFAEVAKIAGDGPKVAAAYLLKVLTEQSRKQIYGDPIKKPIENPKSEVDQGGAYGEGVKVEEKILGWGQRFTVSKDPKAAKVEYRAGKKVASVEFAYDVAPTIKNVKITPPQ